jgi:hypothetical protein
MRLRAWIILTLVAIAASFPAQATLQRGDLVVLSEYVGTIGETYPHEVRLYRNGAFVQWIETASGGLDSALVCDREGAYIADGGFIQHFNTNGDRALFGAVHLYPKSLALDREGKMYVSGIDFSDTALMELNAAGEFLRDYAEWRTSGDRAPEIDLSDDQCTLLGREPGSPVIKSINVCTGQRLPDFVPQLPAMGVSGALRILPDGSLLIANSDAVYRVARSGAILRRYAVTGSVNWMTIAVDPAATTFWAGALDSYWGAVLVYEFNVETGAVLRDPIFVPGVRIVSLGVIGERRAASSASDIPALSPIAILALAAILVTVALLRA